ncbi:MAG: S8 family serine peptidase [Promethearchaeati archaeon]
MEKHKIFPLLLNKLNNFEEIKNKSANNIENDLDHNGLKIIISFKTIEEREKFLSEMKNFQILDKFDLIPSISTQTSLKEIKRLSKNELVSQIEEDQKLFTSSYEILDFLNLNEYKRSQLNYTGKGINIGIIDTIIQSYYQSFYRTGIDGNYIVFEKNEKKELKKREKISHGTLSANLIINQLKDKEDFRLGIAPDVHLYDLSLYKKENFYFSDILHQLDKIRTQKFPIDILLINFSTSEASDGNDILSNACNELSKKEEIIIVVPAGNSGLKLNTIGSPGASSEVITVGSIDYSGKISNFSRKNISINNGVKPDMFFPGSKIQIKLEKNFNLEVSGTSFSAAIATGFIALLKEYDNTLTSEEIKKKFNQYYNIFGKNVNAVRFFKLNSLFYPNLVSYRYLLKRSLWVSLQILIIIIVLFFWKEIYHLIRLIYGF